MRHGACEMLQGLYDISMKLVEGVLKLAPYGVAALLFVMTARIGPAVIQPIAAYVGVVIIGVDRLLDMCRTTVNVTGDLAAAVYVARGEPAGTPPRALPALVLPVMIGPVGMLLR